MSRDDLTVVFVYPGYLNMTTIEFLNHPSNQPSLYDDDGDDDSDMDSDFDYMEEGGDGYGENPWKQPWSPSMMTASAGGGWSLIRVVTRKSGRMWKRLIIRFVPRYRYRQLTRYHRKQPWLRWVPCLSQKARKQRRSRPIDIRNNNMNMDDIFATRTIRPIVVLSEDGPDYEDDMGLDMSVLDEKYPSTDSKQHRNKAARLLDISEEEAFRYQQQLHHSHDLG
ncbi:hypothetical protein DFQ29_002032 [Apophysomyces sp. BC1021]|nr:hypothetical protein DFQ29_002032 [Apophysomyces sp. BC1021]